jgi:hypothetical protein
MCGTFNNLSQAPSALDDYFETFYTRAVFGRFAPLFKERM